MSVFRALASFLFTIGTVLSQPFFLAVDVQPARLIEWDQVPTTFYTGQTMNVTWDSQGFSPSDLARITYPGTGGTRTLSSGASITTGSFSTRLSDASNMAATNVPVTLTFTTNTSVAISSPELITVIQSKLMSITPLDGTRVLGGGQSAVCDDRNLTVTWRGLGEAQFGVASISLSKVSGSPGTLGTSLTNVPVSGNTTVSIVCPRTSTPSTFSQYAFQISVQEPGGSAYTGTSASFQVQAAPSPSPTGTPTPSQTPSNTPSPSFSKTPTPSSTPSNTPTPSPSSSRTPTPSTSVSSTSTPSKTPSQTITPTMTETARPSIDYAAIGRAAADQVDTTTPAVAGALGGIAGVLVLLGGVKWYREKVMTENRKRKQAMTSRFVQQANALYGVNESVQNDPFPESQQPSVVMYSVQGVKSKSLTQTDPSRLATYKKAFPPKQSGASVE